MWNDFVKAVVHAPLLVVCALPNGLVFSASKDHLLLQMGGSVLMLISVHRLFYLFVNDDSNEKTRNRKHSACPEITNGIEVGKMKVTVLEV